MIETYRALKTALATVYAIGTASSRDQQSKVCHTVLFPCSPSGTHYASQNRKYPMSGTSCHKFTAILQKDRLHKRLACRYSITVSLIKYISDLSNVRVSLRGRSEFQHTGTHPKDKSFKWPL